MLSHAFWRYARAMALAGQGKARDAAAEQRRFERERAAVPPDGLYLINNNAGGLLGLAAATLDAQVAAARGEQSAAIAAWGRAVDLQAALAYDEPPPWFYTVRQSLGGALLRAGDNTQAERVFREALAAIHATAGCCSACGRRCSRRSAAARRSSCKASSRARGPTRRRVSRSTICSLQATLSARILQLSVTCERTTDRPATIGSVISRC